MRRKLTDRTQLSAVLLSIVLTVSIVGAVAFLPVAAEHPDDAPDYTGQAFFEVSAVSQSDHYPGQSEGSIRYEAGGAEAFEEQNAEEGVWIDYIIIDSYYNGEQWIDYTSCSTQNTAAFGIDRGNDDPGTNYDQDLVQKQKRAEFRQDGITVEFYDHSDFGGNPPYMAPEDAIVAQQGEGSAGGPCLQFTDEPGWYRIQGFMNGTVADNGQNSAPSENAKKVSVAVKSTWFYICDCESREQAEQKLGPPPGEGSSSGGSGGGGSGGSGGGAATATPSTSGNSGGGSGGGGSGGGGSGGGGSGGGAATATPSTSGNGGSAATPTPGSSGGGSGTPTDAGTGGSGASTTNGSSNGNGGASTTDPSSTGNQSSTGNGSGQTGGDGAPGGGAATPTANDGPGFGALVAILSLLGSALLLNRRRD